MTDMESCRHSPSSRKTLLGRWWDFFLNGETLDGADEHIVCARCGAAIRHPARYTSTLTSILCLSASSLLGFALYGLLEWMKAADWKTVPAVLVLYAAAFLLPVLLHRVIVSAIMATYPWRAVMCEPEYVALHWSAAASERKALRQDRQRMTVMCIIETMVVIVHDGIQLPLVLAAGLLLLAECLTHREIRVVLPLAAALILAVLRLLLPLPDMVALLMSVVVMNLIIGVERLVLKERQG